MNGLAPALARGSDDAFNVKVALRGSGSTQAVVLRHIMQVGRASVGFGVNAHRLNAKPAAGAGHPAGDFTSVGDQDSVKHGAHILKTPKAVDCTGDAAAMASPRPSQSRLSSGNTTESTHSREAAYSG